MANDEKRTKLAKRLYPNLATWEILLWTAGWIFGVGYSIYHVYLASKRKKMIVCIAFSFKKTTYNFLIFGGFPNFANLTVYPLLGLRCLFHTYVIVTVMFFLTGEPIVM